MSNTDIQILRPCWTRDAQSRDLIDFQATRSPILPSFARSITLSRP